MLGCVFFAFAVHCEHVSLVGRGQGPGQHRAHSFQQFQITDFISWGQEPKLYKRSWHSNSILNSLHAQKGRNAQFWFWHLSLQMVSSLLFGSLATFSFPEFSLITIALLLIYFVDNALGQTSWKHLCSSVYLLKRLKVNAFSTQETIYVYLEQPWLPLAVKYNILPWSEHRVLHMALNC